MKIERHRDAESFLARAEPWLLAAEPENNLIIGIAYRLLAGAERYEQPVYLASVREGDRVCGAAFRTPPHQLGLTELAPGAAALLVDDIGEVYAELPGVVGPPGPAAEFAGLWVARHGGQTSVRTRLRVHALSTVVWPRKPPAGRLRAARADDADIAAAWSIEFVRETGIANTPREFGSALIAAGRLFFWEDGGVKCMLASTRETPNGACINAVYTPPELRGRGYASAAVAALSQRFLDGGAEFCCLYTDLANPTSNAIYRALGYDPVCDSVEIAFLPAG